MASVEINVKNPKLARTLDRFKTKIASGDFYEAHQTLRTIANRNVRTKSYDDAIDLLYHGAQILLKSEQPSTGADLVLYLLDIYTESERKVDAESKSKLIDLISLFDANEPTLKQVSLGIINWSVKFGDQKFGDADLHYMLGQKFIQNDALAYDAERHLLLGTQNGFQLYVDLIWNWYLQDPTVTNIDRYASRIVLNYLIIENVKNAKDSLNIFIQKFTQLHSDFKYEKVSEFNTEFLIFETVPVLNLLQLLLITVQTKNTSYFQKLSQRYSSDIKALELNNAFTLLGEIYFGISVPKQGNILQDLMGGFFK
jgi:hypothetical protein